MFSRLFNFFRGKRTPEPAPQADREDAPKTEAQTEPVPVAASVDPAFDEWKEGYPPDWEARRRLILERDNHICQAPGCCARASDIHHIIPRAAGGHHRADNLVALCRIHHAIVHLDTNKIEVDSARCTIVSRHWRAGFEIPIHVRRHRRVTDAELTRVREYFALRCRHCGSTEWKGYLRRWTSTILIQCPGCNGRWKLEVGLTEETATHLATTFLPTQNAGSFKFDLNLIRGIKPPTFFEGCAQCLRDGRDGYLRIKFSIWGRYIGCSKWPRCPRVKPFNSP